VLRSISLLDLKIRIPVPSSEEDSMWGSLAPLQGTTLEFFVPSVSEDALRQAIIGYNAPLKSELGRPPSGHLRVLNQSGDYRCRDYRSCHLYDRVKCVPCGTVPDCYCPPGFSPGEDIVAAASVILSWRDGYHVAVVIPEKV